MNTTNKLAIAAMLTTTLGVSDAMASSFPLFSISENLSGTANIIDAQVMKGGYSETVEITSVSGNTGTFQTSILWRMSSIINEDNGFEWGGINSNQPLTQGIYAVFQGGGTFKTTGTETNFSFDSSGTLNQLNVFFDTGNNTSFFPFVDPDGVGPLIGAQPADGQSFYQATSGSIGDILLGSGSVISGNGKQNCTGSENCGSYGVTTSLSLTADGKKYFVDPAPFYSLAFETGQFNGAGLTSGAISRLSGTQDVSFKEIPEPASLALLGIGMLGIGASRRKQA